MKKIKVTRIYFEELVETRKDMLLKKEINILHENIEKTEKENVKIRNVEHKYQL